MKTDILLILCAEGLAFLFFITMLLGGYGCFNYRDEEIKG